MKNNPEIHYRSFIFGSSRSSVFYSKEWGKYINDSLVFHFDASNEDIIGISQKVKFIAAQGNRIENALLVFDGETFEPSADFENSIIHKRDWRQSGENRIVYHLKFFAAFFKNQYFIKFFDAKINEVYKSNMWGALEGKHMIYTPSHNDFIFQGYIDEIKKDSLAYYARDLFYPRSGELQIQNEQIDEEDLEELHAIQEVFKAHKTKVKIVISPSFDQESINPADFKILKEMFGEQHVFDASGVNKYTNELGNFYEIYHYKPLVANQILSDMYEALDQ